MGKRNRPTSAQVLNFDLNKGGIRSKTEVEVHTKTRAIIYCRVSSKKQIKEGNGLDSQEGRCRHWCEHQSEAISVEKVFLEPGISGSQMNRPALNEAIQFLKQMNGKQQKRITHFVVSEASRISRPDNIVEAFVLEDKIKQFGVKIIKVNAPGIDDSTDTGELMNTMQYMFSKYEKARFKDRTHKGRLQRLQNGYRPFWKPPLGYERQKVSKKHYIEKIDPVKGPIIKQGLEMFATDILVSQADLRKYWQKQNLQTRSQKTNTLPRTFVEKTLKLHRLFFYAGFIIYPDRGINEPIDGKHVGLVTLGTIHKIIKKLQLNQNSGKRSKSMIYKLSTEHPLRGAISCPYCNRKFTSRITRKKRMRKGTLVVKEYPYYGCANNECDKKLNVPKHKLEAEFEELLSRLCVPKPMLSILDHTFEKIWDGEYASDQKRINARQKQVKDIKTKQEKLEHTIVNTKNVKLMQKLEQDRAGLEEQMTLLEEELEYDTLHQDQMKSSLQKVRQILEEPHALWAIGHPQLKQLLLGVRFGENLYYKKNGEHGTFESQSQSSLFNMFKRFVPGFAQGGIGIKLPSKEFMDAYIQMVQSNADKINAIHYRINQTNDQDKLKAKQGGSHNRSIEPP